MKCLEKRGQTFFLTFMIGVTIIILALALAPALKNQIEETRNINNLNCSSNSLSTFDKATCLVADLNLFYYIGGLIFIAGMVITAKIISR